MWFSGGQFELVLFVTTEYNGVHYLRQKKFQNIRRNLSNQKQHSLITVITEFHRVVELQSSGYKGLCLLS